VNCYSGLIYSDNLDIVIDCEGETGDSVCTFTASNMVNCTNFATFSTTSKRKSVIYSLGSHKYLMTASLTNQVAASKAQSTFVSIYRIAVTPDASWV
jgi:hypothetical protein